MTESEIETKVIDIVAEQMGVDKGTITRETKSVPHASGARLR